MPASYNQIQVVIILSTAIIFLLAGLIITLLFLYQKRQLSYKRSIETMKHDFEKSLLRTQVEIQEQTFLSISREIHDNISLSLTLTKLTLNTLDWLDVESSYQSIRDSTNTIGEAITSLSQLSKGLNPELIRSLGLAKAVKMEMDKLARMARIEVDYEIDGEPIYMQSEKELIAFRIVQEAFNNIVKHSRASKVWLHLGYASGYLDILIKDNGVGFERGEVLSDEELVKAGLNNMRMRAQLFGGHVIVESRLNTGTQILITVPY